MRNPQLYVSGKRPMAKQSAVPSTAMTLTGQFRLNLVFQEDILQPHPTCQCRRMVGNAKNYWCIIKKKKKKKKISTPSFGIMCYAVLIYVAHWGLIKRLLFSRHERTFSILTQISPKLFPKQPIRTIEILLTSDGHLWSHRIGLQDGYKWAWKTL